MLFFKVDLVSPKCCINVGSDRRDVNWDLRLPIERLSGDFTVFWQTRHLPSEISEPSSGQRNTSCFRTLLGGFRIWFTVGSLKFGSSSVDVLISFSKSSKYLTFRNEIFDLHTNKRIASDMVYDVLRSMSGNEFAEFLACSKIGEAASLKLISICWVLLLSSSWVERGSALLSWLEQLTWSISTILSIWSSESSFSTGEVIMGSFLGSGVRRLESTCR